MRYLAENNRLYDTPIPFDVEDYEPEYKIVNNRLVKNQ